MLENYLICGLLIGLIFGVPAGAIGALTIQRTLNSGFSAGLVTGLGSSAADLLYACVGIFGMTLVSGFLTMYQRPISLLGGLLIAGIFLGTLCWWSALSGVAAVFRSRIDRRIYQILNWILGGFMLIFGSVVLIKGLLL